MPDDPQIETALLARRLAGERCSVDPETGESCAWYHGFWQFMRLIGLAKTCGGHADFLEGELRLLARAARFHRVLISGAVDHTMAALVWDAYAHEGATADLSVVDRCETPLVLTQWHAARLAATVTTQCRDVLDYERAGAYDVVVTNSFLGYFDLARRARLFARWSALLRPGGKLIFTNRVRPGGGHASVGFTADEARVFVETVRAEARRMTGRVPLAPDDMASLARAYAARFRSVPVRTAGEVVELLRSAGFQIDRLDTAGAAGRAGGPVAGPTLAEAADYVRVSATRA